MPGLLVHTLLAHQVLAAWQREGGAPFSPRDETSINAFLAGSMGPDMGLFPGGERFISDLAHYVHTADLSRVLVAEAGTQNEKAFAWGWVTHVLADVAIHPLVNRRVGEILHGNREREVPYAAHPLLHVQVEVGLDGASYYRHRLAGRRSFQPALDSKSVEFATRAFAATYGPAAVSGRAILQSHRSTARYSRFLSRVVQLIGARLQQEPVSPELWPTYLFAFLPAKLITGAVRRSSPTYAVTHALPPPEWLCEALESEVTKFADHFLIAYQMRLSELPNFNLDTGAVESDASPYPLTQTTLQTLARMRDGFQPSA